MLDDWVLWSAVAEHARLCVGVDGLYIKDGPWDAALSRRRRADDEVDRLVGTIDWHIHRLQGRRGVMGIVRTGPQRSHFGERAGADGHRMLGAGRTGAL